MWTPESVKTGSLNSPTLRAKEAFSNGFCMAPLPNMPKSPPRLAELQSEFFSANSARVTFPDTICSRNPEIITACNAKFKNFISIFTTLEPT